MSVWLVQWEWVGVFSKYCCAWNGAAKVGVCILKCSQSDIVMIWRLPVLPCPKSSFISLPPSLPHTHGQVYTHTYAQVCIHTWMCAHTHTHTYRASFLFCQWLTVSVAVSSSLSAHTHAHNIYPVCSTQLSSTEYPVLFPENLNSSLIQDLHKLWSTNFHDFSRTPVVPKFLFGQFKIQCFGEWTQ